jgi:hypothetical protein
MKISDFGRYPLIACAVVALLAGCAGSSGGGALLPISSAGKHPSNHQKFSYTGARQTFTVPAGVTTLKITAYGASGGGSTGSYGSKVTGGTGGLVKATIPVRPGEELAIFVGGEAVASEESRWLPPATDSR